MRCSLTVVVPVDAVSLDVDTIEFGDASESLFCAAIYARFLRKDGSYSCQLIFSRSKLVPKVCLFLELSC